MWNKIITALMWVAIVLLIPVLATFWAILVVFVIIICIAGLIYFIIAWISGEPIPVSKDGRNIGVLIRGKYIPNQTKKRRKR